MKQILFLILLSSTSSFAKVLTLGAYADTYYAYDFNQPRNRERLFTTQPQRHNEPSLNLGFIDATLTKENIRGRLALQSGNSVEKNTKNYVDEKNWAKYLQESYGGFRWGEKTWIDAGIFLGNIGAESWISRDNYTYTRSMNLDYVPYYSMGLRLEHSLSAKDSVQFQILNGWQNMNENNEAKALGMQYKKVIDEKKTFTYNNFLGDERVVSSKDRFRGYHNFILKYSLSPEWQYLMALDLGHQAAQKSGVSFWYAGTFTANRVLSANRSVALRGEYYLDPEQANIVTGSPHGFEVMSSSINYDQKLSEKFLWRTELRGFYSKDKIYPGTHRWDSFLVTSFTFWI